MKIYTKTGDEGMTSLFGGGRVPKEARRVSAYGDVDELNAVVGVARLHSDGDLDRLLARIQNELFDVGAELATPEPADGAEFIDDANVTYLENQIDSWERQTTPLRQFVLPGGAPAAAHLHHARTVCRRAERHVWQVAREAEPSCISPALLRYLNRLSDLLFVLARAANAVAGQPDTPWLKPDERSDGE